MNLPGVTVEVTQIAALLKERVCNGAVLHDTRGDTAVAFSFSLAKVSLQKKTISRIALFLKKKRKTVSTTSMCIHLCLQTHNGILYLSQV